MESRAISMLDSCVVMDPDGSMWHADKCSHGSRADSALLRSVCSNADFNTNRWCSPAQELPYTSQSSSAVKRIPRLRNHYCSTPRPHPKSWHELCAQLVRPLPYRPAARSPQYAPDAMDR